MDENEDRDMPGLDEDASAPEERDQDVYAASEGEREAPATSEPAADMPVEQDRAEEMTPPEPAEAARRVEIGFAEGDLTVEGSQGSEVIVSGAGARNESGYQWSEDEAGMVTRLARLPHDTVLIVPHETLVSLREVGGDLRAHAFRALSAGTVGGEVSMADLGSSDFGRVEGDFRATGCGVVRVREIGGSAHLDGLRGTPALGRVAGDLDIHGSPGLDVSESIGGDVEIEGCTQDIDMRGAVGGDLRVDGCAGEVRLRSVGGDLSVRVSGALTIQGTVGGDCDISEIAGDVEVRGAIGGDLSASLVGAFSAGGAVGGDAQLATVARAVRMRTVGGDFLAETVAGPLSLGTVGGDARFRTCLSAVQVNLIGGDAQMHRATGGVALIRVGGDVQLDTPLAAGAEYQVRAAGDIRLRVRGEVNARFVAQTQGGEIRTRLPLAVERGRRRNLVGVVGRGDAAVTLTSDGGDISITAADITEEDMMGDEFVGGTGSGGAGDRSGTGTGTRPRSWEGSFGGHKFRVRWDPGAAGSAESDDPDAMGNPHRNFGFEWEHNPEEDRKAAEDFDRQMNDLRVKAEQVARRAAEQAQRYAERAARRARETDWEAIGREVRTAIERAMGDLEDTVTQLRRDFDTRRGPGGYGAGGSSSSTSRPSGAQRVRIEHDDEGDAFAPGFGGTAGASASETPAGGTVDPEAQRRAILEELRAGTISLDEAERRLNALR